MIALGLGSGVWGVGVKGREEEQGRQRGELWEEKEGRDGKGRKKG